MGVFNTSTTERLMELKGRHSTVSEYSLELEQSFEFLMSLRLRHQFQQIQEGVEPDNFIDPESLGTLEKRLLKETFKIILTVQEATIKKYSTLMVM
jgi:CBS domain-containing protein